MNETEFARTIVAMVTPFDGEGAVDYSAVSRLSRELVEDGADGILVSGTTGEAPTLTVDEKLRLLQATLESVGEAAQVWMGTGSYDTSDTVQLTEEAQDAGAHGVMLVTPYYNRPPQEGLYRHFRRAAEACELPVMLYNVPSRTGVDLKTETVVRLAQLDNVVAVKEASGEVNRAAEIVKMTGDDFVVYSGDDQMTLPMLAVGGWGVVSVAAHLVAGEISDMICAYTRGDTDRAAAIHTRLLPLFDGLFMSTNPIPIKEALNMGGRLTGATVRSPLVPLARPQRERLRDTLSSLQLIG